MEQLIERLEKAERPSDELNNAIMALFYRREQRHIGCLEDDGISEDNLKPVKDWVWVDPETDRWVGTHAKPFTSSIDAAMSLVPEGFTVAIQTFPACDIFNGGGAQAALHTGDPSGPYFQHEGRSLALCLCIAALKARSLSHTRKE